MTPQDFYNKWINIDEVDIVILRHARQQDIKKDFIEAMQGLYKSVGPISKEMLDCFFEKVEIKG